MHYLCLWKILRRFFKGSFKDNASSLKVLQHFFVICFWNLSESVPLTPTILSWDFICKTFIDLTMTCILSNASLVKSLKRFSTAKITNSKEKDKTGGFDLFFFLVNDTTFLDVYQLCTKASFNKKAKSTHSWSGNRTHLQRISETGIVKKSPNPWSLRSSYVLLSKSESVFDKNW